MKNKKIKVLTIITKLELGGAQKVALYTANNLGENFESYFISGEKGILDSDKTEVYKNIQKFFNIKELRRQINPVFDVIAIFKIMFIIFKLKPDIVHTHSSKAGIIGRFAGFVMRVKTVVHTYHGFGFHDYQNKFKKKFFVLLERIASGFADKLIFVSKFNLDKAEKEKIGEKNQYTIIGYGINLKKYFNLDRSNIYVKELEELPKDAVIIGINACFKPQKSLLDFIEIAKKLIENSKEKKFYFVMIGDGELRNEIETKIKRYNIQNYFRLLGWRDDVPEILAYFDILLLTSIFEGLPIALLEGMASGVPIITTKVDGIPEIIKDGYNGYLLDCHDINGFVEKVFCLLNNNDIRYKFIENSKKILTDDFDENIAIEKIKKLYLSEIQK